MYLYIAGRAHSGSTILDILLSNSSDIASVGQLVSGLEAGPTRVCSCREERQNCDFWREVRMRFEARGFSWEDLVKLSVHQAHILRQPQTWFARSSSAPMRKLAELTAAIQQSVAETSGRPALLESSKEPTRALFLARFVPMSRIVHLVRDPRDVLYSHVWRMRNNNGYFQMRNHKFHAPHIAPLFLVIASAGWLIGNLLCEGAALCAPKRTIRVRYEDICDQPEAELARISSFLDIDLSNVQRMLLDQAPLHIGHLIGGNEIRMQPGIVFAPKIAAGRALPKWLEITTLILCWPLMIRYGYQLTRAKN